MQLTYFLIVKRVESTCFEVEPIFYCLKYQIFSEALSFEGAFYILLNQKQPVF